jgi:MoxR-like ATPase
VAVQEPWSSPTPPGSETARALVDQLDEVVLGARPAIELAVAAFVAGGHVLIEDAPGVGKTLLAKALAAGIGGSFGRIQGTPDLLPSDVTGISLFEEHDRTWRFQPGPLFHQVVLVDELNRATPRTQSALLEAMAEEQVSVDGTTHPLSQPFFVIATQNPQDDVGTFPLVSGQRDRFMVSLSLGHPGRDAERHLVAGRGGQHALAHLAAVAPATTWQELRGELDRRVHLHETVADYALDIVDAVRSRLDTAAGLSTRAAMAFLRAARAYALVAGRDHVAPDDVQRVAAPVLAHRVVDATNDHLPTARSWIAEVVHHVPTPPELSAAERSATAPP